MKREVLPARSYLLERVAILAATAALAVFATGCTTPDEPASLVELCGEPPAFPGLAAGFARQPDGRLMAVITTETYGELVSHRLAYEAWQDCVVHAPR